MSLLKIIFVLAICVAALGFYRGWFTLSRDGPDATSNKVDVNLSVDPDKMKDDVGQVIEKTNEIGNKATEPAPPDQQEVNIERIDTTNSLFVFRA